MEEMKKVLKGLINFQENHLKNLSLIEILYYFSYGLQMLVVSILEKTVLTRQNLRKMKLKVYILVVMVIMIIIVI